MTTKNKLTLAIVQSDPFWKGVSQNIELHRGMLDEVEADLILLPEMFNTGFIEEPIGFDEDMDGPSIQWMSKMASEKFCLVCGSLIVKEDKGFYNRFVLAYPDQSLQYYDKAHLFAYGGEAKHFTKGLSRPTFEFRGWRIRPSICYDLRFPVWCRNDDDYDLLLNVASWPAVRSLAWTQLGVARAIENQAYYAGCNRTGMDGNGIEYNGLSQVVSYNGEVLLQVRDKALVSTIELDLDSLRDFRSDFPFLKDKDRFSL